MTADKDVRHIAHVLYSFATGGLENGVVNLINRLDESHYRHSIICISDYDEAFYRRITTSNVKIYTLNKLPGKGISWLFLCYKLLKKLRPDICHTRNLSAIEAQLPAMLAGVKYRIHGEHGWDSSDIGGKNKKYQLMRKLFRPIIHRYIVLSNEAFHYLTQVINVPAGKVSAICNGVDTEKFTPKKNQRVLPESFCIERSIVIGTVGRLAAVKNQQLLVKAFIQLWNNYPEARERLRLVLVGDGINRSELESLVENAGCVKAVWFAGQRNDIPDLMNALDVFILPSLAEGISNTLLEAMACGLPFIATDVGGNAELILPNHRHSHIVPSNNPDKLADAIYNHALKSENIKEQSIAVREHCVKQFGIDTMVSKYQQVYQSKS